MTIDVRVVSLRGDELGGTIKVWKDERGFVHVDWELDGVTPRMLNWWWCNMEKGFILWHPEEHKDFYWLKKPKHGNAVGAIQVAPQIWRDGSLIKPCIRWDDVRALPEDIKSIIIYDYVVVVAAISLNACEDIKDIGSAPPIGYRIHQWEAAEFGVRGRSTAIPTEKEPSNYLLNVWAPHCREEILRFQEFLPQLYKLWSTVKDPELNPYFSFRVAKEEGKIKYII